MRCSTLITAMLLTTGFHLSLFAAAAPLDGQHFAIDLKDGEKVQGNDTIALAAGKGDCLTVAAKYNYEKDDYVATQTAQGMAVTFTLMSEKKRPVSDQRDDQWRHDYGHSNVVEDQQKNPRPP